MTFSKKDVAAQKAAQTETLAKCAERINTSHKTVVECDRLCLEAAHRRGRIALRLRLPRSARGTLRRARAVRSAPRRSGERARLSGAKPLADVSVRSEAQTHHAAGAVPGRSLRIFPARGARHLENPADRSRTHLAVDLAVSGRVLRGALLLSSGRTE